MASVAFPPTDWHGRGSYIAHFGYARKFTQRGRLVATIAIEILHGNWVKQGNALHLACHMHSITGDIQD